MGILGAVIGLKGYTSQHMKKEKYPEFYTCLKDMRIGIVPPSGNRGYFSKKIITFNNSVGYANIDANKMPCNLVVREQWLEDVTWNIYLCLEDIKDVRIYDKIVDYLLNRKSEYPPYLGKNDHFAEIKDPEIVYCKPIDFAEEIHSLFYYEKVVLDDYPIYDGGLPFLYKDYVPVALNEFNNKYEFREIAFTNRAIKEIKDTLILPHNGCNVALI
jgi:CRISPR-associated protein Cas5h